MGEVVPARTSPTLHPLPLCINCRRVVTSTLRVKHAAIFMISEYICTAVVMLFQIHSVRDRQHPNGCLPYPQHS